MATGTSSMSVTWNATKSPGDHRERPGSARNLLLRAPCSDRDGGNSYGSRNRSIVLQNATVVLFEPVPPVGVALTEMLVNVHELGMNVALVKLPAAPAVDSPGIAANCVAVYPSGHISQRTPRRLLCPLHRWRPLHPYRQWPRCCHLCRLCPLHQPGRSDHRPSPSSPAGGTGRTSGTGAGCTRRPGCAEVTL